MAAGRMATSGGHVYLLLATALSLAVIACIVAGASWDTLSGVRWKPGGNEGENKLVRREDKGGLLRVLRWGEERQHVMYVYALSRYPMSLSLAVADVAVNRVARLKFYYKKGSKNQSPSSGEVLGQPSSSVFAVGFTESNSNDTFSFLWSTRSS